MEKEKFNIELRGIFTAIEPIFQFSPVSSKSDKAEAKMNSIRIQGVDGNIYDVPIVSGNSFRGILRDKISYDIVRVFGPGEVNLRLLSVMFTGGTMERKKNGSSKSHNVKIQRKHELIQKITDTNVVVSLFGCSLKYDMIQGKTIVAPFVPICQETMAIVDYAMYGLDEDENPNSNVPSLNNLESLSFIKKDDIKTPELFRLLDDDSIKEYIKQAEEYQKYKETSDGDKPIMRQMIFSINNYIPAGVSLYQYIECKGIAFHELGALICAIRKFAESGARLGALHSKGFGKIKGGYDVLIGDDYTGRLNITSNGFQASGDFVEKSIDAYNKYLEGLSIGDLEAIKELI